jgi:hypothetical protein
MGRELALLAQSKFPTRLSIRVDSHGSRLNGLEA